MLRQMLSLHPDFISGLFLIFLLWDGVFDATPRAAVSGLPSCTLSSTRIKLCESLAFLQPISWISRVGMTISSDVELVADWLGMSILHSSNPSSVSSAFKVVRKPSRGVFKVASLSRDFSHRQHPHYPFFESSLLYSE